MTHGPLDRVTRLLRDAISDGGDLSEAPSGRDEAIAKLAAALRLRSRRRFRNRVFGGLAVAATLALVSSLLFAKRQVASNELGRMNEASGVTAIRDGLAEPVNAGARIAEGTELRTPDGAEAHLVFDTGTRVTIGSATRVRLVEQTKRKRFTVETGSFHAKVSKLVGEERFVVTTPDAEVEVHGTAFRVTVVAPDPSCEAGTPTRLEVSEGVVMLRRDGVETRVAAGEHWPSCGFEPPASASTRPEPPPPVVIPAPPVHPRLAPVSAPPPPPSSSAAIAHASALAEQNDLFDDAMRDKHAGRGAKALSELDQLLARYPNGPLAESASIERMRLLEGKARSQAARDYLARWPSGLARAEAESAARAP